MGSGHGRRCLPAADRPAMPSCTAATLGDHAHDPEQRHHALGLRRDTVGVV